MPDYSNLYQSLFNADSVKDGDMDLTIVHAEPKELGRGDGPKEKKLVLYFEEDPRGFVLNKTNFTALGELLGTTETDDWKGAKIQLFFDPTVTYAGKRRGGVGVRAQ